MLYLTKDEPGKAQKSDTDKQWKEKLLVDGSTAENGVRELKDPEGTCDM